MLMLIMLLAGHAGQCLPLRAAYQFSFGKAWSAAAELPQYSILDLGRGLRPMAVNDGGVVLLQNDAHQLIRWTWGQQDLLLENFLDHSEAHLNEAGTVVGQVTENQVTPIVRFWMPGQTVPNLLALNPNALAQPTLAITYVLNDRDQLVMRTNSMDNLTFLPPLNTQLSTDRTTLPAGAWDNLSMYLIFQDIDLSHRQGGILYEVYDMNNYGDTVGHAYEDRASSSAWDPTTVYTYQNQYFSFNLTTVLDFEPLQVNDARAILGRTLGPVFSMVMLDQHGQRDIGPVMAVLADTRPAMSNPDNGLEEIVLGPHYWKRMTERNLQGLPTGKPSPDFRQATIRDIVSDSGRWSGLEATCISANGRIAGTGWVFNEDSVATEKHAFLLVPPVLVPDWDRNGKIDTTDNDFSHKGEPWRFWINNDDDETPVSRSSADDLPGSATPDWENDTVDGLRDVVDFFPVHLDLQKVLQAVGDSATIGIILRHPDGALNFCYSDLLPAEVGDIRTSGPQQGFGGSFIDPLESAPVRQITADGVSLDPLFIANISRENRGVLLLEARRSTTKPLLMELLSDGQTVMTASLPLSIGPVEDMFRIINLRNADPKFAAADPGPWNTRTTEPPNLPDRFLDSLATPLRTLVHIHGYNWGGDESPAAHAEMFKRFYQCGSHARFVGITWFGDQGTLELTGSSFDYNENVINAFVTAKHAAEAVGPFAGPWCHVFAHSLGNMVASSAIVDHGLQTSSYFLIDAAVPKEAYIGETADRRLMVHPDWKDEGTLVPDYAEWLLSPNWARLFPADDNRAALQWKNRFAGLSHRVLCYNFYSSGEEVLRSGTGDLPNLFGDVAHREFVWTFNEMVKGTSTFAASLAGEVHAGWGFNREWMQWIDPGGAAHPPPGDWVPVSPAKADTIDPQALVADPFFRPFSDGDADFPAWGDGQWLYSDTAQANAHLPPVPFGNSPMDLLKNHAKVLAEGIPAHCSPAGSNPLPNILLLQNTDIDKVFRKAAHWPMREDPDQRDRWLHSDYLDTALSHVAGLFLTIVEIINKIP